MNSVFVTCKLNALWISVLLSLLACISKATAQSNGSDDMTVEMLLSEWESLEQSLTDIEGMAIKLTRNGDKIVSEDEIEFFVSSDSQRFAIVERISGDVYAHGQSAAKGYVFNLKRESGSKLFEVSDFNALDKPVDDGRQVRMNRFIREWLHAPLIVHGRSLPMIFSSPSFLLKRVEDLANGEMAVEFDYTGEAGKLSLFDSRIILLKDNHYSIARYTTRTENFHVTASIEYFPERASDAPRSNDSPESSTKTFRFPRLITMKEWSGLPGESELWTNYEVTFSTVQRRIPSNDQFTLSYFGVDEINPKKQRSIFSAGYAIAGICGLLALLLVFIIRRNTTGVIK